jgi:hypothetical protein
MTACLVAEAQAPGRFARSRGTGHFVESIESQT